MSVREDERQKNCPSRGLGIAAAAIGVGVGAALYYFFSKRAENPGEAGSANEWSYEQQNGLLSDEDNCSTIGETDNEDSYTTVSAETTSDTSMHDSTADSHSSYDGTESVSEVSNESVVSNELDVTNESDTSSELDVVNVSDVSNTTDALNISDDDGPRSEDEDDSESESNASAPGNDSFHDGHDYESDSEPFHVTMEDIDWELTSADYVINRIPRDVRLLFAVPAIITSPRCMNTRKRKAESDGEAL